MPGDFEAEFHLRFDGVDAQIKSLENQLGALAKDIQKQLSATVGEVLRGINKLDKEAALKGKTIRQSLEVKDVGSEAFTKASKGMEGMEGSAKAAGTVINAEIHKIEVRFEELAKALEDRTRATQKIIAEQTAQQSRKIDSTRQTEAIRQETLVLRKELKSQLSAEESTQSRMTIAEQASQQKRLARSQTFYRVLGRTASEFGTQVNRTIGSGLRSLLTREKDYNDERVGVFRRGNNAVLSAESSGAEKQISLLRRTFSTRKGLIARGLASEAALERESGISAVRSRTSTGLLGSVRNAASYALPVAGGAALIGGVGALLKQSSAYESALKVVQVATHATKAEIDSVRKSTIALGGDFSLPGLSAKDAADAFRILALSGVSLKTSQEGAAKATLQLSIATKSSAEDAAKAVAAGINTFKLLPKESIKIADALAKTVAVSGSSLTELSDATKQSGLVFEGTFKTAQSGTKSYADMAASLAILAKNGLRGETAGAGLSTMLSRLINPGKKAAGMLSDIAKNAGVNGTVLSDEQGKIRKYTDVLDILRKGLAKIPTEAEKLKVLSQIFGIRGQKTALALIEQSDAVRTLGDEITKTDKKGQGFAARLAKAQLSGFQLGIDNLKSTLETINLRYAKPVEEAAGAVFSKFSELIQLLFTGTGVFKQVRGALLGVGAALAVIVAAKGGVEVLGLLKTIAASALTPFGLLVTGLTAAGAAIGFFASKSPEFRKGIGDLFSSVKEFVAKIVPNVTKFVTNVGKDLLGLVKDIFPVVRDGFMAVVGFFKKNVLPVIESVIGTITTLPSKAAGALRDLVSGFGGSKVAGFFGTIGNAARMAFIYVSAVVGVIKDLLVSGFQGGTNAVGLAGVFQFLGRKAKEVYDLVQLIVGGISKVLDGKSFGSAFDGIGASLDRLFGGLPGKIGSFVDQYIIQPISGVISSISKIVSSNFGDSSKSFIEQLLGFLNDVAKALGRTITAIITDPNLLKIVAATLVSALAVLTSVVEGFLQGVIEKLADRLKSIFSAIPIFGPLFAQIGNLIHGLSGLISTALIAGFAFKFIAPFFRQASDAVKTTFTGVKGVGSALFGDGVSATKDQTARQEALAKTATMERQILDKNKAAYGQFFGGVITKAESMRRALIGTGTGFATSGEVVTSTAKIIDGKIVMVEEKTLQANKLIGASAGQIGGGYEKALKVLGSSTTAMGTHLDELKLRTKKTFDAISSTPAFDKVRQGATLALEKTKAAASGIASTVGNVASTVATGVKGAATGVVNAVKGMQDKAAVAASAVAGFVSGIGIASDNTIAKIGGIVGAVSSIAAGFAAGGPLGGGIAIISTALGFLFGQAQETANKLKQISQDSADFSQKVIDGIAAGGSALSVELVAASDELIKLHKSNREGLVNLEKEAPGVGKAIEAAFDTAATKNLDDAVAKVSDKLLKIRSDKTPITLGFSGFINQSQLDRVVQDFKGKITSDLHDTTKTLTFGNLKDAQAFAAEANQILDGLAAKGQIDARLIFNRAYAEKAKGEFQVYFAQFETDSVGTLDAVATALITLNQGRIDTESTLGKLQKERLDRGSQLTAEEQKTADKIKDQVTFSQAMRDKVAETTQQVDDLAAALDKTLHPDLTNGAAKSLKSNQIDSLLALGEARDKLIGTKDTPGLGVPDISPLTDPQKAKDQIAALDAVSSAYEKYIANIIQTEHAAGTPDAKVTSDVNAIRALFIQRAKDIGGDAFAKKLEETIGGVLQDASVTNVIQIGYDHANAVDVAKAAALEIQNNMPPIVANFIGGVLVPDSGPGSVPQRTNSARTESSGSVTTPSSSSSSGGFFGHFAGLNPSTPATPTIITPPTRGDAQRTQGTNPGGLDPFVLAASLGFSRDQMLKSGSGFLGLLSGELARNEISKINANHLIDLYNKIDETFHQNKDLKRLTYFARGGFINRPTLAMMGEGFRRELVLPLTQPQRASQLLLESGLVHPVPSQSDGAGDLTRAIDLLERIANMEHGTTIGSITAPSPEAVPGEIERKKRKQQALRFR